MEALVILAALGVIGLFFVLPIWALVATKGLQRRTEDVERRQSQRWSDLTARLRLLENRVKELQQALSGKASEPVAPVPTPGEVASAESAKPVVPATAVTTVPALPGAPVPEVKPAGPVPTPVPMEPIRPRAVVTAPTSPQRIAPVPHAPPTGVPPVGAPATGAAAGTPPSSSPAARVSSAAAAPPAARSGIDLEEKLGTRWLNKIGIGILVLGLAFFLAYQIRNLGPGGKVLLGLVLSAGMIAVGVRYDKSERYRILTRAIAAGGWALLYFLSYAVYHLDATRLITSRELDFVLMLAVGAAIVAYSLRYRSQTTTALALGLSYLTVGIHHTSVYSLGASVILALTVVAIALRMQWFTLEVFAIVATYLNHFIWVSPIIEEMGPRRVEFPGFRTSLGLLGFYWLLFRFSYIYRRPADDDEERLSTAAALLNGICLLGMLKYQSVHPEWTFWALLALGFTELGLAAVAAQRRRTAFVVLATLGAALVVAAVPFRYAGSDLAWLWLIAAETFLLAGVFTSEVVFRRVGTVTMFVAAGYMVFVTAPPLVERLVEAPMAGPFYLTAWLFGAGAVLCYANSHWVRKQWPGLFKHEADAGALAAMSFIGGALALLAVWFFFPGLWTAVAWAALALALNVAGKRFGQSSLAVQGNLLALGAIVRLATLNFESDERWDGVSMRLITVGLTALLLYVGSVFAVTAEAEGKDGIWSKLSAGYTWAATILLYVLAWYEFAPRNVAVAWMAGALVLVEVGLRTKKVSLGWQGYAAMIASFARIFFVNLQEAATSSGIGPRVYTVLPVAAGYFYADWRLRRSEELLGFEALKAVGTALTWLGTSAIVALLYFEMQAPWVAAAWGGVTLALVALAQGLKRRDFLYQAFVLAGLVAVRAFSWNFFEGTPVGVPFAQSQSFYVGVAIALLFVALPFAFVWRRAAKDPEGFALEKHPEQVFFFVPFAMLTALVVLEATSRHLTVSWGIEGVVVFLFALWVGERSFRLSGLGLLLVCVVKIFFLDVWSLDPQWRYITLIALGGALVLVSYLYTRYKEKLRRYL
jgi:hypothetical protein